MGALPGVCDHVPYVLDAAGVGAVAATVSASGLRVRSINGDVGDLNRPLDAVGHAERDRHLETLLTLAAATGARALVLPCGALDHTPVRSLDEDFDLVAAELIGAASRAHDHGVELWTESLHYHRLCWNTERAQALTDRLAGSSVGVVMDFSHIVASGGDPFEFVDRFSDDIAHVHIRDAIPGNINLSVGRGVVELRPRFQGAGRCRIRRPVRIGTGNPRHHRRPATGGYRRGRTPDFQPHLKENAMSDSQRIAVITGADSERGIGIAVARRYAREGWASSSSTSTARNRRRSPPTSATNSPFPHSVTQSM